MSSDLALEVRGIAKRYRLGEAQSYLTAREAVVNLLRRGPRRPADTLWALDDVSFDVPRGQVVGVIGSNGAGKSTLLKILSRITEPTRGVARIRGRVGALLEVGTGFHPELTGRENILLNGAILGMSRGEVRAKLDEIVAFSEVERFLDTPVKRYSSGMQMRLAFSVAAHLEPEILIVDEVLAVGDVSFQRKCLGRMSAVAGEGRTVLFVSHNLAAVETLCERAIWLEGGRVRADGRAAPIVATYLQGAGRVSAAREWPDIAAAPGNDAVRLRAARARPADGPPGGPLSIDAPIALEFEYWNLADGAALNLSLHVYNEHGVLVFNAVPTPGSGWFEKPFPAGLYRDRCVIPPDLLNDGGYSVELLVVQDMARVLWREDRILSFDVHESSDGTGTYYGRWEGVVRPRLPWTTTLLSRTRA